MVAGSESTPAEPRPGARPDLFWVWIATLAAGLVTTAVATAAWVRLNYATWPDKDPSVDAILVVVGVGLMASFMVAGPMVAWVRRRRGDARLSRRLRRWAGAWAAALAVAAAGLWGFAHFRDRANHARTTAQLLGTWYELGPDETPWWEVTFRADGTYSSARVTGPANERGTDHGTYLISADGRHMESRGDNSLSGAPDPTYWWWNIEFADRDHFRKWSRVWHYTATDEYVRKE
jgi:hypothetical protein